MSPRRVPKPTNPAGYKSFREWHSTTTVSISTRAIPELALLPAQPTVSEQLQLQFSRLIIQCRDNKEMIYNKGFLLAVAVGALAVASAQAAELSTSSAGVYSQPAPETTETKEIRYSQPVSVSLAHLFILKHIH